MKKNVVYVIQGYEGELPDGTLTYVTEFEVRAKNEQEAMKVIKSYTTKPKKFYRVSRVIEVYK